MVSVSKAQTAVGDEELKAKAMSLLESWSQEEAEDLIVKVALMLGPNEKIFGVFRHGGSVGLTKATFDRPWVADLLVKAFAMKCPEAEFTSVYVSLNSQRDLHVDSNNMAGKNKLRLPHRDASSWRRPLD